MPFTIQRLKKQIQRIVGDAARLPQDRGYC
jgi:hypothetical protein